MKTAIYIEDGVFQVVLTPENDMERVALDKLKDTKNLAVHQGAFYACQGGWYRQRAVPADEMDSTIFVVRKGETP